MILIFLGPPGAGKGTQAKILEDRFGYRQISTGDLLRKHRTDGTALGKEAQGYMDSGKLVPDDLIIRMMDAELEHVSGAILDGFPRTVPQAQALDALMSKKGRSIPAAILFDVPRNVLEERLIGRWTHPGSGRVYHEKHNPPKRAGVDDVTGEPLVQREDDKAETIKTRLDVYDQQTAPLVGYYESGAANRLTRVDGLAPIGDVTERLTRNINMRSQDGAA
jgi:adenylate kinase